MSKRAHAPFWGPGTAYVDQNAYDQGIRTPITPVPHGHPVPASPVYFNGMADNVHGFVTLEEAEKARKAALASGNPQLVAWAGYFPVKWAIRDAVTTPELGLSEADVFSNKVNQGFAEGFWMPFPGYGSKVWCPEAFVATKPETEHKSYEQGPTLPGYASFSGVVGVADLTSIFAASYAAAAAS